MEQDLFYKIREQFCLEDTSIKAGKMMSSEAITFCGKVFAFCSRKNKFVVKLGKAFDYRNTGVDMHIFNPFKKKAPMQGWFELSYTEKDNWEPFARLALEKMKSELLNH